MKPLVALDARLAYGQSTGDSTYWTGLLHGLSHIDSEFRYLLLSNAPKPAGIPESENFHWVTIPAASSRWWSLVRFPSYARRSGARAIHTQYSLSPLAGIKGLTTIHDVSFFIGPEWFSPKDRLILQRTVPSSARRAARVITVSETSKSEIERYIPGVTSKVRVTPLAGHPEIRCIDRDAAAREVARTLGLEGPFLLTVGTRWPRKNLSLAVQACDKLPSRLPHRLVVTGRSGWGKEAPSERVLTTGYVSFAQISALYSSAALYLAPSFHEGFGIPLIEAFSCGCPVLCSAGGALPETAGEAAAVEASWEPEHWTKRIQALLDDSSKLESLRKRGLERATAFTWEETARKTLQVYREVAS